MINCNSTYFLLISGTGEIMSRELVICMVVDHDSIDHGSGEVMTSEMVICIFCFYH